MPFSADTEAGFALQVEGAPVIRLWIEGIAPERPAGLALGIGARDADVLEHALVQREQGPSLPGERSRRARATDANF